jgi:hypothetical protein
MANQKKLLPSIISEETIEHPMEDIFDIESGTTTIVTEHLVPTELVNHATYDEKDVEIEDQFQQVVDLAIEAFYEQTGRLAGSDPKYVSRNMEVANAFLNTALMAIKEKSTMKSGKDKLNVIAAKKDGGTTNITNNTLIMDRNSLLKEILADATPDEQSGVTYDQSGDTVDQGTE